MVVSVTPLVGPPFVDVSYAPPTAASDQLQKYYGPIRIVAVMDPSGELDFG
jgi:hypothetical protein